MKRMIFKVLFFCLLVSSAFSQSLESSLFGLDSLFQLAPDNMSEIRHQLQEKEVFLSKVKLKVQEEEKLIRFAVNQLAQRRKELNKTRSQLINGNLNSLTREVIQEDIDNIKYSIDADNENLEYLVMEFKQSQLTLLKLEEEYRETLFKLQQKEQKMRAATRYLVKS